MNVAADDQRFTSGGRNNYAYILGDLLELQIWRKIGGKEFSFAYSAGKYVIANTCN